MKRYLAIFGFVFIGVIAGLIVRGIPIVLQVQAGGGVPQSDRNGDVNGDARLDMSDAVYLLLHIFRDGPQPVALAQGVPDNMEQLLTEISNPCRQRPDRFVDNGDDPGTGTVTDTCTGLMWMKRTLFTPGAGEPVQGGGSPFTRNEAIEVLQNLTYADFDDWRLPTARECASLMETGSNYPGEICLDAVQFGGYPIWTSTPDFTDFNRGWVVMDGHPSQEPLFERQRIDFQRRVIAVRTAR